MKAKFSFFLVLALIFSFYGCSNSQDALGGDVYSARELNAQQNAKIIEIISILPAKVAISNENNKNTAQLFGGAIGAVVGGIIGHNVGSGSGLGTVAGTAAGAALGAGAGSLTDDVKTVEGVSIAYRENGKLKTSTQAGRACQFKLGSAFLISAGGKETRIQPNSVCPAKSKK